MSERPKEHDSKSCEGETSVGSNPTATANLRYRSAPPPDRGFQTLAMRIEVDGVHLTLEL